MVFQDPMTSLNPVLRIARQLIETMTAHRRFAVKAARERAVALLGRMGMATPEPRGEWLAASVLRRHASARDAGDGFRQ